MEKHEIATEERESAEILILSETDGTTTVPTELLLWLKARSSKLDSVTRILTDDRIGEYDTPEILRVILGIPKHIESTGKEDAE